jgi:hypothetical protein
MKLYAFVPFVMNSVAALRHVCSADGVRGVQRAVHSELHVVIHGDAVTEVLQR